MFRVQVDASGFERFIGQFDRAAFAAVEAGAGSLYEFAQDRVNTLYPPSSAPGEAPHRRSGDGRRSIFFEAQRAPEGLGGPEARCGTTSERLIEQGREDFNYMAHHETHGRPWLLPSLVDNEGPIGGAMESAAKAGFGV